MEMFERQVKRKMREWTEKHIIELIKQYSGNVVTTPVASFDGVCYFHHFSNPRLEYSSVEVDKDMMTDIAKQVLHVYFDSDGVMKSRLDKDWSGNGFRVKQNVGLPLQFYYDGSHDNQFSRFKTYLVPYELGPTHPYNTYTTFTLSCNHLANGQPDFLPFCNINSFEIADAYYEYNYEFRPEWLADGTNSAIKKALGVNDVFIVTGYSGQDDYETTQGYLRFPQHLNLGYIPQKPQYYISRELWQKWYDKFETYNIYIEVIGQRCTVRPDANPQPGRVFYEDTLGKQ